MGAISRSCCSSGAKTTFVFIGGAGTSVLCSAAALATYLGQTPAYQLGEFCGRYYYHVARDAVCDEFAASLSYYNIAALCCCAAAVVLGVSTVATWVLCPTKKREYTQAQEAIV